MNVVLNRQSSTSLIVRGEVSAEETTRRLSKMLNQYSKKINIPGFRPGKAPKSVILARYGEAFREELSRELLGEIVREAIKQEPAIEKSLYTDEPKFQLPNEGEAFTAEVYIETVPELELKKYKEFELQRRTVPVSKEEIDAAINDFIARNATLEERERAVREGDYVEIKLSEGNDEPIPMIIPLDDPEFMNFFAVLVGKSINDAIDNEMDFPDNFPDRRLRARKGVFKMEITKVLEQVQPELNAEFLKKMGKPDEFTVDDFRNEVAQFLRTQKAAEAEQDTKQNLIKALVDANPVDIPPKYLEVRTTGYMNERLNMAKMSDEDKEKIRHEIESIIRDQIAYEFIIRTVADKESVEPSEQEVRDALKQMAYSMGIQPEAIEDAYQPESERYEELKETVRWNKTLDMLLATCTITDAPMDEPSDSQSDENESILYDAHGEPIKNKDATE